MWRDFIMARPKAPGRPRELGAEGAELMRYDLKEGALIWVVGAFKGTTIRVLRREFDSGIHIWAFDPQPHALDHLRPMTADDLHLKVFPFGLGARNGTYPMREVGNDACSFFNVYEPGVRDVGSGEMQNVVAFWNGMDDPAIDLLLLNCEGGEFEILPLLIQYGIIPSVRYILAQFHLRAPESEGMTRYYDIRSRLAETHRLRWDHGPAWVSWERK